MKTLHTYFLYYFNFSGLLYASYNKKFQVSRTVVFLNILQFGLTFIIPRTCLPNSVILDGFKQEFKTIEGISAFAIVIFGVINVMYTFSVFIVTSVSFMHRKRYINFINNCFKVFSTLNIKSEQDTFIQFERKCLNTFYGSIFLAFVTHALNYLTVMNMNWQGSLVYPLTNWNDNVLLWMVTLIAIFLNFIEISLESFHDKIECFQEAQRNSLTVHNELKFSYQLFYKIVTDFNKIFGLFLSTTFLFLVSFITVKVRKQIEF